MEEFFTTLENHEKTATAVAVFIIFCLWIIGDWFKSQKS